MPHVISESAGPEPSPAPQTPTETINHHQAPDPTDQTPASEVGDETNDGNLAGELFPIASTLAGLAAGLVAVLHRLRNTQLRHRRPGTIPTQAAPDATKTEATIRTAAAPTSTEFIDLALRAMARNVTANHIPPPEVVGANLTPETLRILLWTPHHNPPPGWRVDDDGRSWTISTDTDVDRLRHHADGVPAPYPALVTVGHGDHSQLLLDLEYLGATQLTGDPKDVAATCYTMATELAASPIADSIQIICVGFGDDLTDLERIRVVDDLSEILPAVASKAAAISQLQSASPLQVGSALLVATPGTRSSSSIPPPTLPTTPTTSSPLHTPVGVSLPSSATRPEIGGDSTSRRTRSTSSPSTTPSPAATSPQPSKPRLATSSPRQRTSRECQPNSPPTRCTWANPSIKLHHRPNNSMNRASSKTPKHRPATPPPPRSRK